MAVAALLLAASPALVGCAQIMDLAEKVHTEEFADRAAAADGWVEVPMPEWIPSDAGRIRNVATTDETNAVIAVDGGSELGDGCDEGPRSSLPFDARLGELEEPLPESAYLCDGYEVVETADGWLGWFTATTKGERPDQ